MVAVEDLDEAAARWRAAGLPAERGGRHPMGTENVLVRGPRPAYVELIAVGSEESNPWLDRIRAARGPISWAIAVDDMEAAREALVAAGFDPGPATPGSRRTPDGDLIEWKGCDLAAGPYDDALPFLIEWTTPMPPGPADGAVVESISLTPPDPDRVADLLLALGFVPSRHWPRRMFHEVDGPLTVTLLPVGEPQDLGAGSVVFVGDADTDVHEVSLGLAVPSGGRARELVLDRVAVFTHADRRRFPASVLLPSVDEAFARLRGDLADWPNPHPDGPSTREVEYSRVTDAGRYRLLAVRSDAWIEAITSAGLGAAEQVDPAAVEWLGDQHLAPSRATVVRGRPGTQPLTVGLFADDTFVRVGVGEPVEVLELQPDCGCDACDTGAADLLDTIDSAFVLALSGGVYVVREGPKVVTRSLDGVASSGDFTGGEQDRWLAEAADGRRTEGVVAGEPWIS